MRARGARRVARGLPAFQALHPDAQALERRIQQAWARRAEIPADGPTPSALRASVDELARDLAELAVPYEDWQTLYRELLQLDRALRGRPQLLERADGQEAEYDDRRTAPDPCVQILRPARNPTAGGWSSSCRPSSW